MNIHWHMEWTMTISNAIKFITRRRWDLAPGIELVSTTNGFRWLLNVVCVVTVNLSLMIELNGYCLFRDYLCKWMKLIPKKYRYELIKWVYNVFIKHGNSWHSIEKNISGEYIHPSSVIWKNPSDSLAKPLSGKSKPWLKSGANWLPNCTNMTWVDLVVWRCLQKKNSVFSKLCPELLKCFSTPCVFL